MTLGHSKAYDVVSFVMKIPFYFQNRIFGFNQLQVIFKVVQTKTPNLFENRVFFFSLICMSV